MAGRKPAAAFLLETIRDELSDADLGDAADAGRASATMFAAIKYVYDRSPEFREFFCMFFEVLPDMGRPGA